MLNGKYIIHGHELISLLHLFFVNSLTWIIFYLEDLHQIMYRCLFVCGFITTVKSKTSIF